MKSDLDNLMAERNLDALLVTGPVHANPIMYYLLNGAHLGEVTVVIKKRGEPPVIFANSMERDEAAKTGLPVVDRNTFNWLKLLNDEKGNVLMANARLLLLMLESLQLTRGRVAVYGREEQGSAFALWNQVMKLNPALEIVGEYGNTIFDLARSTKDEAEIARIRSVGQRTIEIVDRTWNFLASHRAKNEVLVKEDGSPLTIGDVKQKIRQWSSELNVEHPDDFIFALGRDSAVPHSRGTDTDVIALGKTIVYDIFPAEAGGGYFYDFTRTWCVGYALPEVEKIYNDVRQVFEMVDDSLRADALCKQYQQMTCDFFESRGHPTIHTNPKTTEGYVHGLGHGVGLDVHEAPSTRDYEGNTDTLKRGVVITIEPGLYYPDKGIGVRLEDSVWVNPKTGAVETIVEYKKDLVIPLKK